MALQKHFSRTLLLLTFTPFLCECNVKYYPEPQGYFVFKAFDDSLKKFKTDTTLLKIIIITDTAKYMRFNDDINITTK